jgi:prolycopene isomerase
VPAAAARAKTVVSNATRWDTFEGLMPRRELPKSEQLFRARYKKSPSFLSIHLGVRADVFGPVSAAHVSSPALGKG